jgi:glycosyltransferase involved in cell wall biosynthesis
VNRRIAFLMTSARAGGAEVQVCRLALELASRGWAPYVIALSGDPADPASPMRDLPGAGIPTASLGMRPGRPNPRALFRLTRLLDHFRPAVLHGHLFHANLLARLASLCCPVPVVISTLHSLAESPRDSSGTRLRDFAYRATGALVDRVTAVSQAVAERHIACRAVPRGKMEVVANGVDLKAFRPDPERRTHTRAALGVGDEFVWLAAGRLIWKKDYPTLLRAFSIACPGLLCIAGEGPLEGELRGLAAPLGARVRFLGARRDMPALLNAADAFVLSSVVEGLPMVLLEAAASGLPCVATDVGGTCEAVLDGQTGLLVPPGDAQALGEAMERLTTLPATERAAMEAAARAHTARFDFTTIAAAWERLYSGLLMGGAQWM